MSISTNPLSRLRVVLALAIVGVAVLLALRWRERGKTSDEKAGDAIRKVLDDQAEAWNQGDLEGFMAGYWQDQESPDQKLTFFGSDKEVGWQATYDRYRRKYQGEGKEMGHLTFGDLDVRPLGGDSALVRGRWKLEKKKETVGGLFTLIFQKKPQGWCIVHDHTSLDAPPVPLPPPGKSG